MDASRPCAPVAAIFTLLESTQRTKPRRPGSLRHFIVTAVPIRKRLSTFSAGRLSRVRATRRHQTCPHRLPLRTAVFVRDTSRNSARCSTSEGKNWHVFEQSPSERRSTVTHPSARGRSYPKAARSTWRLFGTAVAGSSFPSISSDTQPRKLAFRRMPAMRW